MSQTQDELERGRVVAAAGIQTTYHEAGSGAAVLLLHGSGPGVSAWANWRGVLPELAPRYRVIAPDLLGFGATGTPPGNRYSLDAWLEHLLALVDELGVERFHVVGNSFGGSLALHLADRVPDRVGRLVLLGSLGVPGPLPDGLDTVWGFTPSFEHMRSLLDLFAYDRGLVTDELARLRLRSAEQPGAQEAFAAMFPPPRQRSFDELSLPVDRIASIDKPTLIIHGRDDRVIPVASSVRLNQLIVDSQLHVFGRSGHWVQIEQRDRFVRLVDGFFAEDADAAEDARS